MSLESENTNAPASFGVDSTMEDKESHNIQSMDREDGELEDGELDDEDEGGAPSITTPHSSVASEAKVRDVDYRTSVQDVDYRTMHQDIDYRREISGESMHSAISKDSAHMDYGGEYGGPSSMQGAAGHDGMSENSDEELSDDSRKRNRKDKRKRKKKRKENEKHPHHSDKGKKKRRRQPQYVDYDKVDDNNPMGGPIGGDKTDFDEMAGWPGNDGGFNQGSARERSTRGRYDSPSYGSNGSHDGGSPKDRGYYDYDGQHNRGDKDGERGGDIDSRPGRGDRSPPGPYDSPYNSPSTQFGSPEDSERKSKYMRLESSFGDYREKQSGGGTGGNGKSMMSMLGDDGYVDPNVAVVEKEEMFEKGVGKSKKKQQKNNYHHNKEREKERREKRVEQEEKAKKRREETAKLICKYYQQGTCHKGENCQYSHACEPPSREPRGVCRNYLHGGCDRENCHFMHGDFPCKYFYKNNCDMGDKCRFSHAELTDETRAIMERIERDENNKDQHHHRENNHRGDFDYNKNKDNTNKYSPSKGGPSSFKGKKPSLLGEPPAHVKEQLEKLKKIPSLFDIKVEKPKNPTNLGPRPPGPHGGPPPNPMSPNGPPMRPGFYNDMMGGSPRMGPMMSGPGHPPQGGGPPPMGPPMGPIRPPMGLMGPRPGGPPHPPGHGGPRGPPPGFMSNYYGGPAPMPPVPPNLGMLGNNQNLDVDAWQENENQNIGPAGGNKKDSIGENDDDGGADGATQEFLSQLNPSQRELFLNLQKNKKKSASAGGASESSKPNENWKGMDDNWYSSDEDGSEKKIKSVQENTPQPPKLDISTMLNMLRNTVTTAATSASQSPSGPHTAVRDPRVGSTSSTTRPDPRAAASRGVANTNTAVPTAVPESRMSQQPVAPAPLVPMQSYDPHKVINASLQNTGGVPYFLYKVSVDIVRPMLPKAIDPEDPKYKEDPRVRRYGRIGSAVDGVNKQPQDTRVKTLGVAVIDPRRRPSAENSPDLRMQRVDQKSTIDTRSSNSSSATISSVPKALLEPLVSAKLDTEPPRPMPLPEGLKKPLIPLPKLLDPRMGRQLSIDKEKEEKHRKDQTSPSTSKTPFSHRNDPRFRKKSKDGHNIHGDLNSSAESDSAVLMDSESSQLNESHQSEEEESLLQHQRKNKISSDNTKGDENSADNINNQQELNERSPSERPFGDAGGFDNPSEFVPSEKTDTNRRNPMEFASPLGYYSEAQTDSYSDGYNSYTRPLNKETASIGGSNIDHVDGLSSTNNKTSNSNDPRQNRGRTIANTSDNLDQENTYPGSMTSMLPPAEIVEAVVPTKSIKEMFNIDPTASPFGSI